MQKTLGFKARESLRTDPRSGAAAAARNADRESSEPEPAAAEAEERGERELALATRLELIARAVDIQIVIVLQTFRMREKHYSHFECAEAKALAADDDACPANRTAAMDNAELCRDDQ